MSNVQQEAPGESGQRMTRPAHLLQVRATRQVRESVGTTLGKGPWKDRVGSPARSTGSRSISARTTTTTSSTRRNGYGSPCRGSSRIHQPKGDNHVADRERGTAPLRRPTGRDAGSDQGRRLGRAEADGAGRRAPGDHQRAGNRRPGRPDPAGVLLRHSRSGLQRAGCRGAGPAGPGPGRRLGGQVAAGRTGPAVGRARGAPRTWWSRSTPCPEDSSARRR